MVLGDLLIVRIALVILSIILISILIKIKAGDRIGNQLFFIGIIFWGGILIISINPSTLDGVLNNTGLVNRSQFLFGISLILVTYLLLLQITKNKGLSSVFFNAIRNTAITNFEESHKRNENIQVLIVITAKNEEKTIGIVIDKINSHNFSFTYNILVVNDGSTDKTGKVVQEKKALMIDHVYNLGIGAAVKTGLIASKIFKPEIVINIDADGQHDPKYIPILISKIKEGNDLVYGSRFASQSKYHTSTTRLVGNKFYTKLVNKIAKINLTDVTSGYRAITGEKIDSILFKSESNFAIELVLRAARNNLVISEIPIEANTRKEGRSQFFRIERFLIFNFNVLVQVFNVYFKK